jgi:hypothetical protein
MSERTKITETPNINTEKKKKKKNKRAATSPLSDDTHGLQTGLGSVPKIEQSIKKHKESGQYDTQNEQNEQFVSLNPIYFQNMSQNMSQLPPYGFPTYMTSPPQAPMYNIPSAPASPSVPTWALEMLEEIKQIKQKLSTVEEIKKTVNKIQLTVSDLDLKFKSLESRVDATEKSCEFVSKQFESHINELAHVKGDIKKVRKACDTLENNSETISSNTAEIDARVTELESKTMRENLMFYGITEKGADENCIELVKTVMRLNLEIADADAILIDRAYRVGKKDATKTRPICAKFHYPREKDLVRSLSFDKADSLKKTKLGIGAQIPKAIRDARKPSYPAMKEAKKNGKTVKFIGAKLYIDGKEYITPATYSN